jgi:hypothetical protein
MWLKGSGNDAPQYMAQMEFWIDMVEFGKAEQAVSGRHPFATSI